MDDRENILMDNIVKSIIDYIKRENTNYAVMIDGEWGSGKTYFWNNVLRDQIESTEVNGESFKTIYVSLYGIKSIEEISKKLFFELLSIRFSNVKDKYQRITKRIPEIGKTFLQIGIDIGKNIELPFIGKLEDLELGSEKFLSIPNDTVLCFDDLERVETDINSVMGYINQFVEHDNLKVIIIGNENEIEKKQLNDNIELKTLVSSYLLINEKSEANREEVIPAKNIDNKVKELFGFELNYKRIKEKLIGKTYRITIVDKLEEIIENIIHARFVNDLRVF